jgi:nicotinate phosphoribosyltransferase
VIELVMQAGKSLEPRPTLDQIRARAARELARLPEPLRRLDPDASYPVEVSDALRHLAAEVDGRMAHKREAKR